MIELVWAAGFLEGEGCFKRVRVKARPRKDGTSKTPYFSQSVDGAQIGVECLLRLQRMFGGKILKSSNKYKERTWTVDHWQVYGSRARGVMMTLYKLLSTKRQAQVRAALEV